MKHYGAQLAGGNNTVDGNEDSILTVGTNDSLIIMTPNTTGGQTLDGTLNGLVINSANGSTHVLGADGREIAISSLSTSVNTALTIPIANAGGTAFVDSSLTQTSTADGNQAVTAGGNLIVAGDLTVRGTTLTVSSTDVSTSDTFITLAATDLPESDTTTVTTPFAGLLIEDSRTSDGTTEVKGYGGLRWNESTSIFQFSANTTNGSDGDWTDFGAAGAGIQSVNAGAGIDVSTAMPADANNPVISLDLLATTVSSSTSAPGGGLTTTPTGATGELSISYGGITAGNLATDIATTRTGLANGSAGQALVSEANGGFTWANVGTVVEYIARGTKATTTTFAHIPQTTHGISFTGGAAMQEALTVQVYEEQSNRISQIIPEAIFIYDTAVSAAAANGVPGEGAAAVGDVFVVFGETASALNYRVIIKG